MTTTVFLLYYRFCIVDETDFKKSPRVEGVVLSISYKPNHVTVAAGDMTGRMELAIIPLPLSPARNTILNGAP